MVLRVEKADTDAACARSASAPTLGSDVNKTLRLIRSETSAIPVPGFAERRRIRLQDQQAFYLVGAFSALYILFILTIVSFYYVDR